MVQLSHLISAAVGAGLAVIAPAAYNLTAPLLLDALTEVAPLVDLARQIPRAFPWPRLGMELAPAEAEPDVDICRPDQGYRTELVSLDPLLIYIHGFVSPREAELVIRAGEKLLQPSPVTGYGGDSASRARTSWSAPLPGPQDDAAVACVLHRAESFTGTLLKPGRDGIGTAQLVHYDNGQKFDLHHDWFRQPRLSDADRAAGRRRLYNRVATFFVVLQANCTGGETYFPEARPIAGEAAEPARDGAPWRQHDKGGLAFSPIAGNALFWLNLAPNGTGDMRTLHAGLPVGAGTKTAMNIWPRAYFGPDA